VARPFGEALAARPLLFEPVPPSVRAEPVRAGLHTESLVRLLRAQRRLDAVNVPELVDENHDGRPYYRSGDTRRFAATLAQGVGCEAVVNKVVAHLPSAEALAEWARETVGLGLRHAVLVGGSSRYIPYSGPPVAEANRICAAPFGAVDGRIGNIAIPQRTGEAHRMLAKTRAGAGFFTTQILFDGEAVSAMVREYGERCAAEGVTPAAVLLSVAPLTDEADCEFVRWLGAEIPEEAERMLLGPGDEGAARRAGRLALEVWAQVRDRAEADRSGVPLGVNVEQISQRHLSAAVEMLGEFARAVD
jgi:5,10-methylenetetrahydrofolate reductase